MNPRETFTPARPLWAAALSDPEAFAREQAILGKVWTFLGFREDVAKDGDWFRTLLGGRSIFVQRFGDEIRAFENRCAHRFYPLRTADRGNGPVVCGYHHWRYNADGVALGIPKAKEYWGCIPREMNMRLERVEIGTIGALIFGRFAPEEGGPSLETYLGPGADLIRMYFPETAKPARVRAEVKSNWRLCHHIALDDYHVVAIHPSTFGKNGYLNQEIVKYLRFGAHSCFMEDGDEHVFAKVIEAARAGTYLPRHYVTFNLFPNFTSSQFFAYKFMGVRYYYVLCFRQVPVAHDRSIIHGAVFPAPREKRKTRWGQWLDDLAEPLRARIVRHFARKVLEEDNTACEVQQTLVHEIEGEQRLCRLERRIGWYEEVYARFMRGEPAPDGTLPPDELKAS